VGDRRLAGHRIAGATGPAALASGLVQQLPRHLDDDGAGGERLAAAVPDLVHVGLAAQLDRATALPAGQQDRALLVRCRAYVEQHLADPRLTPTEVAAAQHVSVRRLHRLFEPGGEGVAELIRRRRLDCCRRDLLDPGLAHRPVSATGARWAFPDPAHFSRVFRAAHGLPPGEFSIRCGTVRGIA
jgi:AraC-like DNA-binding protein